MEWCTKNYNLTYGTRSKRVSKSHIGKPKPYVARALAKRVQCIDTGIIYESASEARRQTGIKHIDEACSGARQSAGGMWWKYI